MQNRSEVIIQVFVGMWPDKMREAEQHLSNLLPRATLSDYGDIDKVFRDFCRVRAIDAEGMRGTVLLRSVGQNRRELIAVLCLLFHPERIYLPRLPNRRFPQGFVPMTAKALACTGTTVSEQLSKTIVMFAHDAQFRKEAMATHQRLLDQYIPDNG